MSNASVKIRAIRTGLVSIKETHYQGRGYSRWARLLHWVLGRRFREPIPVFCWLIEHPEGLLLVDTGLTAEVHRIQSFPLFSRLFWAHQFRFEIVKEQEVVPQLKRFGVRPDDIRWIVLTHSHLDHTSGIEFFPQAEFVMSRKEYDDVRRYGVGHGSLPCRWPSWFAPTLLDFPDQPLGPFASHHALTEAGDIQLVPTPGHTRGHLSVILQHEGLSYFFAGDTSLDQDSLLHHRIDGVSMQPCEVLDTYRRILAYAKTHPTIYLPTHDPCAARRLCSESLLRLP